MNQEESAEIMLETAAMGYVAQVQNDPGTPEAHFAHVSGAREYLHRSALAYAAARGNLDAGERAKLHALRRFRDGVAALRTELHENRDGLASVSLAIETIDAFFALSYPPVST